MTNPPIVQFFIFVVIAITPIVLITRNMFKKLLTNDLKLATFGKKRIKGKVLIKENDKTKPTTYKGRTMFTIHLVSRSQGTPHVYLSHYDEVGLYNPFEIHSILTEYELKQVVEVEYVEKTRLGKGAVIVAIDGFPIRGRKATSFHWFGLVMMLMVCFFAVIAVGFGIIILQSDVI